MSKSYDHSFVTSFKLPNPGLRAYFGNVVKGQPEIYDTPFAKGESTEDLLKAWDRILKSIAAEWPTLYDFEQDLRSKVGPLSVMLPLKDRKEDIQHYYDDIKLPSTPIDERALKAVLSEWKSVSRLQKRSQPQTVDAMKKSSNSGSPFFTKRRKVIKDTMPCTVSLSYGSNVLQILPSGKYTATAILGWRGQEGGYSKDDVKQRVVWMFPFAVNIEELSVYQPLIETAQNFDIVPAWVSMEDVDEHITQLFDTKGAQDLVVCTDFSKYDQHFNSDMQDAAKYCISRIFADSADMRRWLESVYPIKYNIPLAINYGEVWSGPHGMGSGSGGTNADETLTHRALQYEAAIHSGARLNPHSMCLGDDGILSYPGITVDDVVRSYTSHGQEMNSDKQYASTQDCVFLRRWHHANYRVNGKCAGVYSTFRALGRLRYLERFMDPKMWGPKMVALRQLSILENIKFHPLKEQFVEFCMKRDKYRLGLDIPHFLDDLDKEAKKATAYMPDFLGYTKTLQSKGDPTGGINDWWIVNYLRNHE
nr:MAG: RNA-dependent RNA polymerase [Porcine picobirnavirus]